MGMLADVIDYLFSSVTVTHTRKTETLDTYGQMTAIANTSTYPKTITVAICDALGEDEQHMVFGEQIKSDLIVITKSSDSVQEHDLITVSSVDYICQHVIKLKEPESFAEDLRIWSCKRLA